MSDELNSSELHDEEEQMLSEFRDRYVPRPYRQVFYLPSGDWRVEGLFEDSFYRSARLLLQAVIEGKLLPAEGVAAVFLCRHYLELALKYALFHSRWLEDERRNAQVEAIGAISKNHDLKKLWDTLSAELAARVPSVLKTGLDLDFVGVFIEQFHQVDQKNWRFRYSVEQIAAKSGPADVFTNLGIDFSALLANLEHAHGVLDGLDSYLVETYGENEEWESIQKSF